MSDSPTRGAVADREAAPTPIDRFVTGFQAKRPLYIGGIIGLFALFVVILLVIESSGEERVDHFSAVWDAYSDVRERVRDNQPATEELAQLERELAGVRGTDAEASALWLSAIARYGSAFTRDKLSASDRRPLLEGAKAHLEELKQERFDHFPPALTRWYTTSGTPPVEQMLERVTRDLEWLEANGQAQPGADDAPTAVLRTDLGDIHLRFFGALAPQHRDNFISLATKGSYNGTAFHFVRGGDEPVGVLGGDPFTYFYNDPLKKDQILRWGGGGTGYDLPPEESRFRVVHARAIVTAQRRPNADWDNGAQFQILLDTDPKLDRVYSPFAQVVEGMDVVEAIAQRRTASQHGPYKDDPLFQRLERNGLLVEPVWIQQVILYGKDGKALEHAFSLESEEQTLAGLKGSTVKPLEEKELNAGRKLRGAEDGKPFRRGLDFPFPEDIDDVTKANPLGDRRVLENVEPGGERKSAPGGDDGKNEGDDDGDDRKKDEAKAENPKEGDTEKGDG